MFILERKEKLIQYAKVMKALPKLELAHKQLKTPQIKTFDKNENKKQKKNK